MIGNLTEEQIAKVLTDNTLGRIGCNDGKRTYIVPVNYVFDGKYIIAHAAEGMKINMMRDNPSVCFEVDEIKSYTQWKSVVLWGEYQELTGERDRYYALKLFVDRMMHLKISQTAIPPQVMSNGNRSIFNSHARPVIYRIVIVEKTGRFEQE